MSVIIPFWNGSRWIEDTLKSVHSQSQSVAEILIVDDNSRDSERGALEGIVNESELLNVKIMSGKGLGQSAARNLGASIAAGGLLFFLDQDDIWKPTHVEKLASCIYRGAECAYSNVDLLVKKGHQAWIVPDFASLFSEQPKVSLSARYRENFHILPSALAFDKDIFLSLGGFDESLRGFEDDELIWRAWSAGTKITFLNESTVYWRDTPSSSSDSPLMKNSRAKYFSMTVSRIENEIDGQTRKAAVRYTVSKFAPHVVLDSVDENLKNIYNDGLHRLAKIYSKKSINLITILTLSINVLQNFSSFLVNLSVIYLKIQRACLLLRKGKKSEDTSPNW